MKIKVSTIGERLPLRCVLNLCKQKTIYLIFFTNLLTNLSSSYKCDEFVINDTKTGDVQLVRDTLEEAAAQW